MGFYPQHRFRVVPPARKRQMPFQLACPNGIWYIASHERDNCANGRRSRVVLPKALRGRFRLRGGDVLAIEVRGDAIELRPTQAVGQLKESMECWYLPAMASLEAGRTWLPNRVTSASTTSHER